jgi:hypothetical protein
MWVREQDTLACLLNDAGAIWCRGDVGGYLHRIIFSLG